MNDQSRNGRSSPKNVFPDAYGSPNGRNAIGRHMNDTVTIKTKVNKRPTKSVVKRTVTRLINDVKTLTKKKSTREERIAILRRFLGLFTITAYRSALAVGIYYNIQDFKLAFVNRGNDRVLNTMISMFWSYVGVLFKLGYMRGNPFKVLGL
jgi:hypothetical protein